MESRKGFLQKREIIIACLLMERPTREEILTMQKKEGEQCWWSTTFMRNLCAGV